MDTKKAKKNPVKLTKEQWQEIRTRWENDPREGHSWLVNEMSLPLTHNTIFVKAKREGWTKLISPKKVAEQAHRNADNHFVVCHHDGLVTLVNEENPNFVNVLTNQEANEIAIDLRTSIIQGHRDDAKSFRDVDLKLMDTMDGARIAKIKIDAIKVLHDIERKAWNLDANVEDTSAGVSTNDEMDAIYSKAMAESRRMQKEVEKRKRESE